MELWESARAFVAATGDWASVGGVLISLFGFWITFRTAKKSKSAAEQARIAVDKLREDIGRVNVVAECSTAIGLMEQIKSLHRHRTIHQLPDKYAALRMTLITLRSFSKELNDEQCANIQSTMQILKGMEKAVEKAIQTDTQTLDVAKYNHLISKQTDSLQEVLVAIKKSIGR